MYLNIFFTCNKNIRVMRNKLSLLFFFCFSPILNTIGISEIKTFFK